jgi:hypothetical protein
VALALAPLPEVAFQFAYSAVQRLVWVCLGLKLEFLYSLEHLTAFEEHSDQILEFLYSLEHLTSLQDHSDQMQEEEPDELPEAGASQESEEKAYAVVGKG